MQIAGGSFPQDRVLRGFFEGFSRGLSSSLAFFGRLLPVLKTFKNGLFHAFFRLKIILTKPLLLLCSKFSILLIFRFFLLTLFFIIFSLKKSVKRPFLKSLSQAKNDRNWPKNWTDL